MLYEFKTGLPQQFTIKVANPDFITTCSEKKKEEEEEERLCDFITVL
jgi:hypothetical protein